VDVSNIILSPGAYGNEIMSKAGYHNKISSMIGLWLELPVDKLELNAPIKLARSGIGSSGPCKSANIIPGNLGVNKSIYVSSGHGFTGFKNHIEDDYLLELSKGVVDVSKKFFPENFNMIGDDIEKHLSYCLRPWTASCLPIFDAKPIANGIMITTTGQNTGGFAQAPMIAMEIINVLSGNKSKMLELFHHKRATNYTENV
jgi:glycine/D-amino acid oxidase-like deaminating enzyme